jgi:hypothetical protein
MTAQLAIASFAPVAEMTASVLSLAENHLLELDYALDGVSADEADAIHDEQAAMIEKALAMPAACDDDRAKQVRMLLNHVMPAKWLGADEDLDWDVAMARRLLLKFAGLDPMVDPTSGE